MIELNKIYIGDWIEIMRTWPNNFVQCVVTSPSYWGLCGYAVNGQLGLEKTPEEYVKKIVAGFREVRRILRKDGILFLNLGDSYISGRGRYSNKPQTISNKSRHGPGQGQRLDQKPHPYLKDKNLCGIPWRVALALQADGW